MAGKIERGYLALADISGFTQFMAASELEHAQDILAELMELIIDRLAPVMHLVELEGDAVYVYSEEREILSGEMLVELYETAYVSFRDRVEGIRLHTTCTCNACRLIPTLDLKFITHCGDFYMQNVAGRLKPVGSAVNLLHRLSKNQLFHATGWRAYALFSAEAIERLALPTEKMHFQVETYEHLGDVATYSIDLHERYDEITDRRRIMVTPEEADALMVVDVPAAPPVVWEWLNDPQKRGEWQRLEIKVEKMGRRGAGTRNHCLHGKKAATIQTVLDWRPFEYYTYESQDSGKPKPNMQITHRLEPSAAGSRLTVTMKLLMPLPRLGRKLLAEGITRAFHIRDSYARLAELVGAAAG